MVIIIAIKMIKFNGETNKQIQNCNSKLKWCHNNVFHISNVMQFVVAVGFFFFQRAKRMFSA